MRVRVTWVEQTEYETVVDIDEEEFEDWKTRKGNIAGVMSETWLLAKYLHDEDDDGTLWLMQAYDSKGEGEHYGTQINWAERVESQ